MSDSDRISDEELYTPTEKVAGAPGVIAVPEDPAAPSRQVSSGRQRLSDLFTIVSASHCAWWLPWRLTIDVLSSAQALP